MILGKFDSYSKFNFNEILRGLGAHAHRIIEWHRRLNFRQLFAVPPHSLECLSLQHRHLALGIALSKIKHRRFRRAPGTDRARRYRRRWHCTRTTRNHPAQQQTLLLGLGEQPPTRNRHRGLFPSQLWRTSGRGTGMRRRSRGAVHVWNENFNVTVYIVFYL